MGHRETVAWTRTDVKDAHDLGLKVRASSTMPLFMPPTTIDGHTYMDGGMGDSWGILLNAAAPTATSVSASSAPSRAATVSTP